MKIHTHLIRIRVFLKIIISSFLPQDGVVRKTEHDGSAEDYDEEEF